MANVDNFVLKKEWLELLLKVENEQERNAFLWNLAYYGIFGEFLPTGDSFKDGWLRTLCNQIDYSKQSYQRKVESGRTVGRAQAFSREELKEKIRQGMKAVDIAKDFKVSTDAIYQDAVWKNRKKNNFYK